MARGNSSMVGLILLASVAAPAVARAQTAEPQSDDITIIAERAVTATKTDTPLVETPQAISVVDDALFHDRGARNVQETLRYSAGVTGEAYGLDTRNDATRSEEHTSELQSLMRISYAVFCLKKKKTTTDSIMRILRPRA